MTVCPESWCRRPWDLSGLCLLTESISKCVLVHLSWGREHRGPGVSWMTGGRPFSPPKETQQKNEDFEDKRDHRPLVFFVSLQGKNQEAVLNARLPLVSAFFPAFNGCQCCSGQRREAP